jgi:hypothetical protein
MDAEAERRLRGAAKGDLVFLEKYARDFGIEAMWSSPDDYILALNEMLDCGELA